jgi:hypothetical protein
MKLNISPDNIKELKDGEIFVFGSNLAGTHGAGAAKQALKFGAVYGEGNGRCGWSTYAIPTKDKNIKTLPPKAPGNPSSANYAFQFPIEGQEDMILVLGTEARGTAIEDYELSTLNKVIEENGGSINIKLGNDIFEDITKVEKIAGNKQADFIFVGKNNLYVQHKDTASQQLAGVKKLENNPEVKEFVNDVKQISGGTLQSGMSYKRKVESPELQLEGAYGVGDQFGIDKVQSIIFGNIELKPSPDGKYFEILGPVQFNYPQPLTGDYELYMFATYRGYGINQQGIKNCRIAFYPKKYYSAAKSI